MDSVTLSGGDLPVFFVLLGLDSDFTEYCSLKWLAGTLPPGFLRHAQSQLLRSESCVSLLLIACLVRN